eukprot:m.975366 g.975366  ORF g.975366 m.975366 type:complete len:985 (-) comp23939_c0_seq12:125-3079(-)
METRDLLLWLCCVNCFLICIGARQYASVIGATCATTPDAQGFSLVPMNVTSIGFGAYMGCTRLLNISIAQSVTAIETGAFDSCFNLINISLPTELLSIGDGAFIGCSSLSSISIPSSVTVIGEGAFQECPALASIYIPSNSTVVSNSALPTCLGFGLRTTGHNNPRGHIQCISCSGKYVISVPSNVTSIGVGAFFGCKHLTRINIPSGVTALNSQALPNCLGFGLQMKTGNFETGAVVCIPCAGLTRIQIPDNVTSIGTSAFDGCSSIVEIDISSSVTIIGEGAFYRCTNLINVSLPPSITQVGRSAFYSCIRLTEVRLPPSLSAIAGGTFGECTSLVRLHFPDTITSIGDFAFQRCYNLTTVVLPPSVTVVGPYAFQRCYALATIVIPAQTQHIGVGAFANCTGLESVAILGPITAVGNRLFEGDCACCAWIEATVTNSYVGNLTCAKWTTAGGILALDSVQCASTQYLAETPTAVVNDNDNDYSVEEYINGWNCAQLVECNYSHQYQAIPPTATTNRVCVSIRMCNDTVEYELTTNTLTSNRICSDISACNSLQYVTVPPTATSNTVCASVQTCDANQHATRQPTSTTDRVCATTLTTLDAVLITLCGLIAVGMALYCGSRVLNRHRTLKLTLEDQEKLLQSAEAQWSDAATTVQLMQAAWVVPETHVTKQRKLSGGSGRDTWVGHWGNRTVAVTVLKHVKDSPVLHRQCTLLYGLRHPNLVIFYGASTGGSSWPFLLSEFMELGSLWDAIHIGRMEITPLKLSIALGIAKGMAYLHQSQVIHGKLKSTNVLLDHTLGVKIGDVGMRAFDTHHEEPVTETALYDYASAGTKLDEPAPDTEGSWQQGTDPNRSRGDRPPDVLWMAPEVFPLHPGGFRPNLGLTTTPDTYDPAADVYSYGIILWELTTTQIPWEEVVGLPHQSTDLFDALLLAHDANQRPVISPALVSNSSEYATVVQQCWDQIPSVRPCFSSIVERLQALSAL